MKTPSGFVDVPDSVLAAHQIVTEDDLVKIAENANFAMDRCEIIFMGFYKNGDEIPAPASPVDGYQYSRSEVMFDWIHYATFGADDNFVSGQAAPPSGGNGLTQKPQPIVDINDATGKVSITQDYFAQGSVAESGSNDGVLKVFAVCQRASVNMGN